MGEIEKTLERLNEVLVKAGFAGTSINPLYKDGSCWRLRAEIELRFDEDGKFIKPDDGEY